MTRDPREYDHEFTSPIRHRSRRRIGYSHDRGTVTRFVVQLEYWTQEGWTEVVRFDHDPESDHGHDVSEDGVHLDVYRNGRKYRTTGVFPPMTPAEALTFAEDHLTAHAERYLTRFERWHGLQRDR